MTLQEQFRALKSASSDKNLLTHMQAIFSHLLTSSASKDIFQQFEDLSLQIKTAPEEKVSLLRESYTELQPYVESLRPLLVKP